MNRKQFTILGMITVMGLGAVIGWSINTGNPSLAMAAALLTAAVLNICKRSVTEVMEDERIYRISEKASRKVFNIAVFLLAMSGVVLISMKNEYPELGLVGFASALVACALLILYLILYAYYSRHLE